MYTQTNNRIQTLIRLGLTSYEGKVFLALEQTGTATAKTISKISSVPREKVYGVLVSLMEMGLISKVITAPTTYKAVPLNDAVTLLLERRLKDYMGLCEETTELLKDYKRKHIDDSLTETSKLVLMPNEKAIVNCLQTLVGNAEVSIDWVTTWKQLSKVSMYADELGKIKKKEVKFQTVVQNPDDQQLLQNIVGLIKLPCFQLRTIAFEPPAMIWVFDKKQVLISAKFEEEITEQSAIVTGNPAFVALANCYFENMWRESREYKDTSQASF
ncbi:MAG: hypothetical protein NWF05_08995 [Candidatus Bathyarchaeota archaeon]|nr:hypothetical protein [Candidatus Bathyarchaeota archaeon]